MIFMLGTPGSRLIRLLGKNLQTSVRAVLQIVNAVGRMFSYPNASRNTNEPVV